MINSNVMFIQFYNTPVTGYHSEVIHMTNMIIILHTDLPIVGLVHTALVYPGVLNMINSDVMSIWFYNILVARSH